MLVRATRLAQAGVDWDEFNNDYNSRGFLQAVLQRLEALHTAMDNARILHDWDNYHAALTDYDYTKYKYGTSVAGYETKVKELGQFFIGGGSAKGETNPPAPENSAGA
jgi:hypothetical protein